MSLYLTLKDQLLKHIVDGTYAFGQRLPTEHELAEQYQLSRVTVRKALEELKRDGLIAGVPRQGTVITHRKGAYRASLDIIALVAAVKDPFFGVFMEYFEQAAEENGSLMLFKQDFHGKAYQSDALFLRFIQKNIRNVVMWPQIDDIDFQLLQRLRSVGMNFVFFDQEFATDVADVVCLDNRHAVASLYRHIRAGGHQGEIIYIGFENLTLPSALTRERAFLDVCGGSGRVFNIPWRRHNEHETEKLLDRLHDQGILPAGIICNSGGIGLAVAKHVHRRGWDRIPLGTIDFLPEMRDYPMAAVEQPLRQLAEKAYQRLAAQNNQGKSWQPGRFLLEGQLIVCGERQASRHTADL